MFKPPIRYGLYYNATEAVQDCCDNKLCDDRGKEGNARLAENFNSAGSLPNQLVYTRFDSRSSACDSPLESHYHRVYLQDIQIKGASTGPAAFGSSAARDGRRLPVLEIGSALHFVADLTLGPGEVVFDYVNPESVS